MTAGALDRAPDRGEIAVQDEHHVVRQAAFGKRGEAADVGEQDRDLALAALGEINAATPVHRIGEGRQQRRHLDRALGPQLAGEADIGGGHDAAQYPPLGIAGGIEAADLAAHPHPASRAAPAAAAHMGMRYAGEAARLEHAGARDHVDEAAVGVADANEPVAALPEPAHQTRQQYRSDQAARRTTREWC